MRGRRKGARIGVQEQERQAPTLNGHLTLTSQNSTRFCGEIRSHRRLQARTSKTFRDPNRIGTYQRCEPVIAACW
jgi:hypothetical protein